MADVNPLIVNNCGTCMYFKSGEFAPDFPQYGGCHRYPPQRGLSKIGKTLETEIKARLPSCLPTDWCGEFRQGSFPV